MSIKEVADKSKTLSKLGLVSEQRTSSIPSEEEFDIVSVNEKGTISYIFIGVLFILIASASYGIGRLSYFHAQKIPIEIITQGSVGTPAVPKNEQVTKVNLQTDTIKPQVKGAVTVQEQTQNEGSVVASKNGTKYYYPTCSGAKRILEKNKVYYESIEDARKAGLTPSTTCKGLK
jgi:hypothetical protein